MQVAVLTRVLVVLVSGDFATVAEVMAFVNHDKIVVSPVDVFEVEAVACAGCARQVGMIENIITQTVGNKRIVDVVTAVCYPVVVQFLRA